MAIDVTIRLSNVPDTASLASVEQQLTRLTSALGGEVQSVIDIDMPIELMPTTAGWQAAQHG